MSLVLQTTKGKSHLINLIDTPGHVNFLDEVASGIRVADGAVVVVDAVEGILMTAQMTIQHLVATGVPIVSVSVVSSVALDANPCPDRLVLNKVDRLILELRLPPGDAYFKLRQTIEEVNTVIS